MEPVNCRICLGEASQRHPIYRRCNCAHFHDSCFNDWLRHHNSDTCEICGTNYEGVRRVDTDVILANLQYQAWVWLVIYSLVIVMIWILKGMIENYSQCIYTARDADQPETSCDGWNAIEEMLFAICGVSTAAVLMQALASCVCPTASGLIISKRYSKLIMVPGQGQIVPARTEDMIIAV